MRRNEHIQGQPCAYCGGEYQDREHVFAHAFLLPNEEPILVPSCKRCNLLKKKIEDEFTIWLPLFSRHESVRESATQKFGKNLKLWRQKKQEFESSGLQFTRIKGIRGHPLKRLVEFMVRGLHWHHWVEDRSVTSKQTVQVDLRLTDNGADVFNKHFFQNKPGVEEGNLGKEALVYRGVKGNVQGDSFWMMQIFGGLSLLLDESQPKDSSNISTTICAIARI